MLCVVVLLCSVGVVFGQYVPICNDANFTGSAMPPPSLPTQFSVVIELNIGPDNRTSDIKEYVDEVGNRGRFEISSTNFVANTVVGIFDYDNREIFLIPDINNTGDACAVKPIATPSAGPFDPTTLGFQVAGRSIRIETINRFFQGLRTASIRWVGVEDVRGIPCNRWQTCTTMQSYSYTLDYYFATDDWEFALGDAPTPVQMVLNSVDARRGAPVSRMDIYSFVFYDTGPTSVPDDVFTVPIGLLCTGRSPGRPAPRFPDYFSLSLESVQRNRPSAVVYKEFYDSPHSLSRVDVYYDGRQGGSPGPLSIIRDLARNVEYIINRQLNNCTVQRLDDEMAYFQTVEGPIEVLADLLNPVTLLLFAQEFTYTYEGVTNIRGVDVDAWIGRQEEGSLPIPNLGIVELRNGTWELFSTRPGWRITGDRTVTTEPVIWRLRIYGKATVTAANGTTSSGIYSATYDIFDFSSEEPDFDTFDVSTCFSPSEYQVLSLAIPGHEQGLNFSQLRQNLRSAIVAYASVQPLQVGSIQITGENGTHIFVSLHISNPARLAATDTSKTADEILLMIQSGTVNGRLPFQISTGLGTTVTPLLLSVNPQDCDGGSCFAGLNDGQAAGLGIGLLIVGLVCGILGTLLVLLVIRLCCSKSSSPKSAPISYKKQDD